MLKFSMNTILVLLLMSSKTLGKTKPISGRVKSDSNIYLSNVRIESLPSKSTTKTDKNGMFFFEIPIKDKILSFDLNGFHPKEINVIPYRNDTVIELVKIIEVNYLDSINTSIGFVLSRDGDNITSYDMNDMLQRGLNRTESVIHWDKSIIVEKKMNGKKMFRIDGLPSDEMDVLFGGVKINNIEGPASMFVPISNTGLSEVIISKGGYSKFSASSESIHYLPIMNYENKLSINGYSNTDNNSELDGFGAISLNKVTVNGGVKERDHVIHYSDSASSIISTFGRKYFSSVGFTNRKNLEVSVSGFQNLENQYDSYSQDSLEYRRNSVLTKVDQWSPLTGRIRINGLYQDRLGYNNNQLDALNIDDICRSLGFTVEKDFNNHMLTFATNSKIIASNWNQDAKSLLIDRQNSILTWSLQSFFPNHDTEIYFKNVKAVFSKERTTDVKDPNSDIDIVSNYWDDHSFQISTRLESQKENKNSSVYLSFGKSNRIPLLQDVIKSKLYSLILFDDRRLLPEEKSSIELVYQKNVNYTRYKWKYLLRANVFNHTYQNKIKQIPLIGNVLNIPQNTGKVNRSGIGIHFEMQPYAQRFRFSSNVSYFSSSNFSKLQMMPDKIFKNQLFIHNKYFDFNLAAIINGKRSFTYIDSSNMLIDQELQRNVNYSLQISKSIQYKMINIVLSIAGENLRNDIVLIDDIITNEKKYSFDIRTTLQ
tara:strand:+ start:619 stop:2745 length:2127 start_codon:yes stop_codon:yes gene_type:complete